MVGCTGMVGMKGVSVEISKLDTTADEPRVADADSKNSGMFVATMEV